MNMKHILFILISLCFMGTATAQPKKSLKSLDMKRTTTF